MPRRTALSLPRATAHTAPSWMVLLAWLTALGWYAVLAVALVGSTPVSATSVGAASVSAASVSAASDLAPPAGSPAQGGSWELEGPPQRPNVLLVVADDMAWSDFPFLGHPEVRTPNLQALVDSGVLFEQGYVPTSLCRASLATLLTGLYAHQHHICCNDPPAGVDRQAMLPLMAGLPTLPRYLLAAGYPSLQTGKFWEGHYSNAGFTHGMTLARPRGRHGDRGLAIGRQTLEPIFDFVERAGKQPWMVWYAPLMPHTPHEPPLWILQQYREAFARDPDQAAYWAMITWFDHTVGQLLDFLEQRGELQRTLVVFLVDNGWAPTSAASRRDRKPRSKLSPYDAGVRTPILFSWPGRLSPARRQDLVSSIDILPTLMDALALPAPDLTDATSPSLPGLSLWGNLLNGQPVARDTVFGEIFKHAAVDLDHPGLSLTHRWLRHGDLKLIVPAKEQRLPELYDLARDPRETRDLYLRRPREVEELRELLDRWWSGREGMAMSCHPAE